MTILEKLVEIQSELKAPKSQYNNFGKYNYRNCEDILEAVKPLMKERGCVLVISDDIVAVGNRVYVKATATIMHGENTISNTAFAREAETKKGMDESQITGAASSYARKYALNGLFAIDDTNDADSEKPSETAAKQQQQTPPLSREQYNELMGMGEDVVNRACKNFSVRKLSELNAQQAAEALFHEKKGVA
jgi:hypothetical protein